MIFLVPGLPMYCPPEEALMVPWLLQCRARQVHSFGDWAELQKSTLMAAFSRKGQYLQARSFKGLMQNIGQDQPTVLEQGRYGVAQGYREFA